MAKFLSDILKRALGKRGSGGTPKDSVSKIKLEITAKQMEEIVKTKKVFDTRITSLESKTDDLGNRVTETLDVSKKNQERLNSIEEDVKKVVSLSENLIKQTGIGNGGKLPAPETTANGEEFVLPPEYARLRDMIAETGVTEKLKTKNTARGKKSAKGKGAAAKKPRPKFKPLASILNDMDALDIVLRWIRYLTERVGTDGSIGAMRYYTQIGWISPEVEEELTRYIETISSSNDMKAQGSLNINDHSRSLFFIAKLKELNKRRNAETAGKGK